jgi:hypothetical protein
MELHGIGNKEGDGNTVYYLKDWGSSVSILIKLRTERS